MNSEHGINNSDLTKKCSGKKRQQAKGVGSISEGVVGESRRSTKNGLSNIQQR